MPYIKKSARQRLDPHIASLAIEIQTMAGDEIGFAGLLNYVCTTLALKLMGPRSYARIALVCGIFTNIKDEFYRRYAAPYEDEKAKENGDVYN